ncbi:hypothetical protein [Enterococcus sp. LJL90]
MKRKIIVGVVGLIFVLSAVVFFLRDSTPEVEIQSYPIDEVISTQVNSPKMTYDEFVTNTLKVSLKGESAYEGTLQGEDKELRFIQAGTIFESFMYLPDSNSQPESAGVTDADGITTYSYSADSDLPFSFYGENEGWNPIPVYLVIPGDVEAAEMSYKATALFNNQELELWEEYTETPVYDAETNSTKGLLVFKMPLGEHPSAEMEVDLTVSINDETFA